MLTGVYLHGSLAMGYFNPAKSDIDLILVINGEMQSDTAPEFCREMLGQLII